MKELESKYKVANFEAIEKKLIGLGARFARKFRGVDTYFVVPNNPGGRKYLRVREKDGKCEISFQFVHNDIHTDEWETEVEDAEVAKEIFKQLGYKVDIVVDKKRCIYHLLDSEISLDEVKHLGSFVEIESPSENEIKKIAKMLGLEKSKLVKGAGYPDLLKRKSSN